MANAWCINAYDCNGCLIQTLQNLDSACIGVGVQYTAPNPLDDKRLDYIKYTDKCGCTCCLSWENEILIYATDWVIKNLTLTNDDVNEAIKIQWNDIFWSNRAKTVVRYKTGSAPVSITDWTLAVEETTKNQYSSTPFSLTGVLDETTYYITAFAVDSNNVVIWTQQATITTDFWWHPSANTLAYRSLNWNTTDWSWNWHNWTISWNVWYTNQWTRQVAIINWTQSWIDVWWSFMDQIWTWDFTISIWMNLSWNTWYGDQVMFAFWKELTPRPWFSMRLRETNVIKFCVWDWSSTWLEVSNASSYQWWWHNFIMTRKNWVVSCYIDNVLKWTFTYSKSITWIDSWWIVWRNSATQYLKSWTKWAEVIVEKVWWDSSFISKYYNHSKTQFWL